MKSKKPGEDARLNAQSVFENKTGEHKTKFFRTLKPKYDSILESAKAKSKRQIKKIDAAPILPL